MIDEQLKQFATIKQAEIIDAINKYGSQRKAAAQIGISKSTIQSALDHVKKKASRRGYSPDHDMTHTAPEPFIVKGTSSYYNKDGQLAGQWVKTAVDDNKMEVLLREAIEGFKSEIPKVNPTDYPILTNSRICNCYVITDYHLGMLSWQPETGADWDISIAEDLIIRWFERAIALSPDSSQAVFAQLSDFLHFDGMDAVTPASKHLLDVDTRFAKLVRSAIRILRTIIDMLLNKHKTVHLIMADANHDPVSQIWLREWLSVMYENEPRITVDKSPNPYNAFEFGKVALFFHHGHKRKVENVSEVFAGQFRELFGRTKYAYAHTGHLHSINIKENNLMIVEQHRTLAPPDAYAARGGWLSGRDAKVITYHEEYGEVSRLTINSDMLK